MQALAHACKLAQSGFSDARWRNPLVPSTRRRDAGRPTLADALSASMCDDEKAFRAHCHKQLTTWDTRLASSHHHRGLAIRWEPHAPFGIHQNSWGVGHLLIVVFRLHALCLKLQRMCYIDMYGEKIASYFTYADKKRTHWAFPRRSERAKYGHSSNRTHYCNTSCAASRFAPSEDGAPGYYQQLHEALRGETAPLLFLTIKGFIPFEPPNDQLLQRLPNATNPQRHRPTGLDPCLARWVSQPTRGRPPPLHSGVPGQLPSVAVHMRTGFADAQPGPLLSVPSSTVAATAWAAAACDPFPAARFVMSDAPGLLRGLRVRQPELIVAHGEGARARGTSATTTFTTRSWGPESIRALHAVLDDVVTAGSCTELEVATPRRLTVKRRNKHAWLWGALHLSALYTPIVARSFCIRRVRLESTDCPRFDRIYARDFTRRLELTGRSSRALMAAARVSSSKGQVLSQSFIEATMEPLGWAYTTKGWRNFTRDWAGVQAILPEMHPCKSSTRQSCYYTFVAGNGAVR